MSKSRFLPLLKPLSPILFLGVLALAVPYLPALDASRIDIRQEYLPPGHSQHWLGTGENGVDILAHLIWGARLSLGVALGSVLLAAFIGLVLGSVAGFFRGAWDQVIMRLVDTIYAFPGLLLIVALAVVLGPSVKNIILVLVVTGWASYARIVRAQCLSLRERDFVQAARAVGLPELAILLKVIWPSLLPAVIVQMTYGLGSAILTETSLSFLGLGAEPGAASWGALLNQGREVLASRPHVVIVPSVALVSCVLGLNMAGDRLRDLLDPKMSWKDRPTTE